MTTKSRTMDRRKNLPSPGSAQFADSVHEAVSVYLGKRGDPRDRGVTLRDLEAAGLVELSEGFLARPGSGVAPIAGIPPTVGGGGAGGGAGAQSDLTPPPTPSGAVVIAGIDFLMFRTDRALYRQGHGHARTRVYGATWTAGPKPTFADALPLMEYLGEVDSYPTTPATQWHIWLTWISNDGVESVVPAGGTNGYEAKTGQDVTQLLEALEGKLRGEQLDPASNFRFKADLFTIESRSGTPAINPFTVLTTPTLTAAGELLPVGVYMEAAYIRNLEVALGRFQNAFITNAMIVSVSASRITSGVISVGNYIQSSNYIPGVSGWRIHGDGTASFRGLEIAGNSSFDGLVTIRNPDGSIAFRSGGVMDWSLISGAITDKFRLTGQNITTFVEAAAIPLALINRATIGTLSAITTKTGTLTIDADGFIRMGRSDFASGDGLYFGRIGLEYGFILGGADDYISWRPSSGLVIRRSTIVATIPGGPVVHISPNVIGQVNIGARSADVTGGSPPYRYQWTLTLVDSNVPVGNSVAVNIDGAADQRIVALVASMYGRSGWARYRLQCVVSDSEGRATWVSIEVFNGRVAA